MIVVCRVSRQPFNGVGTFVDDPVDQFAWLVDRLNDAVSTQKKYDVSALVVCVRCVALLI